METEYQRTLHFCDADPKERKSIYSDIGYVHVSMNLGNTEERAALKAVGMDVAALDEHFRKVNIMERICKYPFSKMLEKSFSVELYSDFEEGKPGWGRTASADTVFYFFTDAIVSLDVEVFRRYLDDFHEGMTAEESIGELVDALIQSNVSGKAVLYKDGVDVYVEDNGDGHHSVGLLLHPCRELSEEIDYYEYYFEDEPEGEEEPPEEGEEEE